MKVAIATGLPALNEALITNLKNQEVEQVFYSNYIVDNNFEVCVISRRFEKQTKFEDIILEIKKKGIRIILLTNFKEYPGDIELCFKLGINDIINDPINLVDIVNKINNPTKFSDVEYLFKDIKLENAPSSEIVKGTANVKKESKVSKGIKNKIFKSRDQKKDSEDFQGNVQPSVDKEIENTNKTVPQADEKVDIEALIRNLTTNDNLLHDEDESLEHKKKVDKELQKLENIGVTGKEIRVNKPAFLSPVNDPSPDHKEVEPLVETPVQTQVKTVVSTPIQPVISTPVQPVKEVIQETVTSDKIDKGIIETTPTIPQATKDVKPSKTMSDVILEVAQPHIEKKYSPNVTIPKNEVKKDPRKAKVIIRNVTTPEQKNEEVKGKTAKKDNIIGNVTIAVMGTGKRVGVTYTSIKIANILKKNYKVAVIEINGSSSYRLFEEELKGKVSKEQKFNFKGVDYYKDCVKPIGIEAEYQVIIYDLGTYINQRNTMLFNMANKKIIVTDAAPWNKNELIDFCKEYRDSYKTYSFVLPNSNEKQKSEVAYLLQSQKVYVIPNSENAFEPDANTVKSLSKLLF